MADNPPRRWYQFRLSTILVLVAITAWGMACWPSSYVEAKFDKYPGRSVWSAWFQGGVSAEGAQLQADMVFGTKYVQATVFISPAMVWPAVALAAFLTWKLACAIAARRRRRRREAVATSR